MQEPKLEITKQRVLSPAENPEWHCDALGVTSLRMTCHSEAGFWPKNLLFRNAAGAKADSSRSLPRAKSRFLAALGMTERGARNENMKARLEPSA